MNLQSIQSFLLRVLASRERVMLMVGLGCLGLLGVGYFLEIIIGLVPCALCIIQRGFFLLTGVVALLGAWHGRFLERYAAGMFTTSLLGGIVAVRNVYIERVPQGLDVQCIPWMESFTSMIEVLFNATGDCSVRGWTLLGLSVPEWSLISFLVLIGLSLWLISRKEQGSETV